MIADAKSFFHTGETITAVKHRTGEVAWNSPPVTRRNQFNFNFGPRLITYEDVVLFAGGDGQMLGLSAVDGKQLWSATHPNSGYQSPQDLMVVGGLVWCAPTTAGKDTGVFTGRDPRTGEVKKEFPPNIGYWFHRFLLPRLLILSMHYSIANGVEFVDPPAEVRTSSLGSWRHLLYGIMRATDRPLRRIIVHVRG
ncbi:MAG: PQQ-binding-like beta-propeller repeat protein [Pirellulales bacterium]